MGITRGPNIIRDGLIMGYDTGYYPGIRKSYKGRYYGGQPTVNLVGTQTKQFGNWSGLSGTTEYYTTEEGNQGIKLETLSSGGVNWYSCTQMQNILPSTSYTISATVRYQDGGTPHPNLFYVRQYNSSGNQTSESGKFSTSFLEDLGNGWKRAYRTFTTDSACDRITLQGYEYTVGRVIYMQDIQFEQRSNHTPFAGASTTRSNTQSIIDLAKQRTFDVSTASFNSDANLIFDGADDYITVADNPNNGDSAASWEFVVKFGAVHDNETSVYRQIYIQEASVWIAQYYDYIGIDLRKDNNSWFDGNGGITTSSQIGPVSSSTWYHGIFTFNNGVIKGYLNGVLGFTETQSGMTGLKNGTTPRRIGRRSSQPLLGDLPVFKVYDIELTAQQVQQNFNAYKTRFGI